MKPFPDEMDVAERPQRLQDSHENQWEH